MGLTGQMRVDLLSITTNKNDFGVDITLTDPLTAEFVVVGFNTHHHTAFDQDGVEVNTPVASVAIAEQAMVDSGFGPIRNAAGEVDLNRTPVKVTEAAGVEINYVATKAFPDEQLGLIVLILSYYTP